LVDQVFAVPIGFVANLATVGVRALPCCRVAGGTLRV